MKCELLLVVDATRFILLHLLIEGVALLSACHLYDTTLCLGPIRVKLSDVLSGFVLRIVGFLRSE